MESLPPRPAKDFRISSVQWWLDIEETHRRAGFDPVPREHVIRRFFAFIDFLQNKNLTTRTIARTHDEVDEKVELRNFDLTDLGYRFTQRYWPKWTDMMHQEEASGKEGSILEKWWKKFEGETDASR